MPEEINRILTDQISDLLFTTEASAERNLLAEGVDRGRIHFVGNTMIDTLAYMLPRVEASDVLTREGIDGPFGVATFHRPSNVDRIERLTELVAFFERETPRLSFVFPIHPRTRTRLHDSGLLARMEVLPGLRLLGPQPYTDFMRLVQASRLVVTDSGGIQEETTWLGIPCLTQRTSTERPSTVEVGTNTLLGEDFAATSAAITSILEGRYQKGQRPPLWDGACAPRIVSILEQFLLRRHA
jgi:UDP-N-acetylglucosamine 2-epimerase (non-hydrolysing)